MPILTFLDQVEAKPGEYMAILSSGHVIYFCALMQRGEWLQLDIYNHSLRTLEHRQFPASAHFAPSEFPKLSKGIYVRKEDVIAIAQQPFGA